MCMKERRPKNELTRITRSLIDSLSFRRIRGYKAIKTLNTILNSITNRLILLMVESFLNLGKLFKISTLIRTKLLLAKVVSKPISNLIRIQMEHM